MTVNLSKNKAQILDAWKKVTENEDGYDWALFGYEGKSFDLKVDSIGCGGLEQVVDELNEGKIQYAFVRIHDPNTGLVKFLLINFQGEAVLDLVYKGTCSNHIRDITKLLRNHLTITASNVEDLDEENVMKKMSNITSAYNFHDRVVHNDEKFTVGTNYSKVVPTREIDSVKRDEFWKKEEEMEKARVAAEHETKRLANLKLEEERLKREQNEHQKRELLNKQEVKKIPEPIVKHSSPQKVIEKVEPARPRAEEMRMDRRKEAQELIGNRVNTAKALFQQQAASISQPAVTVAPAKPIRKTIHKIDPEVVPASSSPEPPAAVVAAKIEITSPEPKIAQHVQPTTPEPSSTNEYVADDDDDQFSTIKRSPKTPDKDDKNVFILPTENIIVSNYQADDNRKVEPAIAAAPLTEESSESEHKMLKAVALYDYQAVDDTEISFDPGDVISHIDQIDEGWWQGYSERFNQFGLFPANYVELIP